MEHRATSNVSDLPYLPNCTDIPKTKTASRERKLVDLGKSDTVRVESGLPQFDRALWKFRERIRPNEALESDSSSQRARPSR